MFVSVCVCVFFFVGPLLTFFSLALDLGLNILPLWVGGCFKHLGLFL